MNKYLNFGKTLGPLFSGVLLLASCSSGSNKQSNPDTLKTAAYSSNTMNGTLCFQHLSGSANQDTSIVKLQITGNSVSGSFHQLIYEKDRRKGTLRGTIEGDTIKAIWTFMQEGVTDSLEAQFKLGDNKLFQQEYSADPATGRQFLSENSAFTIEYKAVECSDQKF